MDPFTVMIVAGLATIFGIMFVYISFFRPQDIEGGDQPDDEKPIRFFGRGLPDKTERYATYRRGGIIAIVITLGALFAFVQAIITLMTT